MPARVGGSPPVVPTIVGNATSAAPLAPAARTVTPADGFGPAAQAASTLETVFTPGDAAKKMELASIQEVISARKADPTQ